MQLKHYSPFLIGVFLSVTACSKGGENGGTSTDVGGGGSGIEALWHESVEDLEANLRLLVAAPIELTPEEFALVKEKLPDILESAKLKFVDYPLMLGSELATVDNPTGARFVDEAQCPLVMNEQNAGAQRDAINFPSVGLIKVSRPRFVCYVARTDQLRRLVLHEYLGLLGFSEIENDKTTYRITNALLEAFRVIHKFEDGLEVRWVETCSDLQRIGTDGDIEGGGLHTSVPTLLYKFANDIDCSGVDFRRVRGDFVPKSLQANLDGNGYRLRGVRLNWFESDTGEVPFSIFRSNCSHCVIANLRVEAAEVEGEAILISRNAGKISNVSIEGRLAVRFGNGRSLRHAREAGALARENLGIIENVNVEIEMAAPSVAAGAPVSPSWSGGFVGSNYGNIARATAVTTLEGSGFIGGFVGLNMGSINGVVTRTRISATGAIAVGGLAAINEGRIERINVEGSIAIARGTPHPYPPGTAVAPRTISGGLVAIAREKAVQLPALQLLASFPFSIGNTLADVSTCGYSEFANPVPSALALGKRAPLIGYFDGDIDATQDVNASIGPIYESFGIGQVHDSCEVAP